MARLVARRPATLWGGASYWPVASAGCLPHSFGDGGASASTAPAVVSRQPQQQQQQQQRQEQEPLGQHGVGMSSAVPAEYCVVLLQSSPVA